MIAIIGFGGFAREVYGYLDSYRQSSAQFYIDDVYYDQYVRDYDVHGYCYNRSYIVKRMSELSVQTSQILVAVGDPSHRKAIVDRLPSYTDYGTLVHPSAIIGKGVNIGKGCIICPGVILTVGIDVGNHVQLNLHTTVGHDTVLHDFVTTAPKVAISGNCTIGNGVYLGTGAAIKEKINICDDVTVGLNAGVVSDIINSGTYVGTPCKKIS